MFDDRRGCLGGLLQLFLLDTAHDWLQRRFGLWTGVLLHWHGLRCDHADHFR